MSKRDARSCPGQDPENRKRLRVQEKEVPVPTSVSKNANMVDGRSIGQDRATSSATTTNSNPITTPGGATTNSDSNSIKDNSTNDGIDAPDLVANAAGETSVSTPLVLFPEGMQLNVGDRVEVQWDLQQPENEGIGSIAIWWGATYTGLCSDGKATGTVKPHAVHTLLYDARAGYPETSSEVVFLSMSRLLDVGEEDTLMWRYEGQDWLCDSNDQTTSQLLETPTPDVVMTMQDLLQDQKRLELMEHGGVSVQSLGMAALARLPYLTQTNLASNFRTFADSIKEHLAEIRRVRGAGATVTIQDIRAIMEKIEGAAA